MNLLAALAGLFGMAHAGTAAVNVQELRQKMDEGAVPILVDVRTPGEYATGHVPTAINLPLAQLDRRLSEIAKFKEGEVFVICRSGSRSARGASFLVEQGFTAINVTGGTLAWQAAGFDTKK